MLKKYQFTNYGGINALLSLIPLVPVLGIIPSVALASGIEKLGATCEASYQITLLISAAITGLIVLLYTIRFEWVLKKFVKSPALYFGLFSAILYVMVGTMAFIMSVGVDSCCHGDGQTGLAVFFSAPYASAALVAFGIIVDVKKNTAIHNN